MPEPLDDPSAVRKILERLGSTEELRRRFPMGTTAVFRLVLAEEQELRIEFLDGRSRPRAFRNARLSVYWVDSDPLALLEKPLAYFVFEGRRLREWCELTLPIIVGGRRIPAVKHDPVLEVPVGNAAQYFRRLRWYEEGLQRLAIDSAPRLPPELHRELPALSYPLPPTELPGGGTVPDEPGTTGSGPAPVGTDGQPCTPVNFVTCLLMQGKKEDGKDAVGDEAKALVKAFAEHGYQAAGTEDRSVIRAKEAKKPVEAMLEDLLKLMPQAMCKCPPDQVVIIVAAHEGADKRDGLVTSNPNAEVSYYIEPLDGDKPLWMPHARFAELLSAALKTKGIQPNKLRLVIFGCYSGDGLDTGRYGKHLPGALVLASTPDRKTHAYTGAFSAIVKCCLEQPAVKSWADFVKCLKLRASRTLVPVGDPPNYVPAPTPAAGRPPN